MASGPEDRFPNLECSRSRRLSAGRDAGDRDATIAPGQKGLDMAVEFNGHLADLKQAFQSGRLTLYLGAGVSKPNGLPSWEELVQALYFTTPHDESFINELRPFPN